MSGSVDTMPFSSPRAFSSTYGALYVGLVFTTVLFGFGSSQVVTYIQRHWKRDPCSTRIIVIWLWSLDAARFIFIAHVMYHYLIQNFGNYSGLSTIVWSFKAQMMMGDFAITSTHCFYVHRIAILDNSRKRIYLVFQIYLLIVGLALEVVLGYYLFSYQDFKDLGRMQWVTIAILAVIAFNDFIIAVSMVYFLAKYRAGFEKTNTSIKKFIIYVCGSGCLTSVCSITAMVTSIAMPNNFIYLAVEFPLMSLYVNSYIALLNARRTSTKVKRSSQTAVVVPWQNDEERQSKFRVREVNSQQTLRTDTTSNYENGISGSLEHDISD